MANRQKRTMSNEIRALVLIAIPLVAFVPIYFWLTHVPTPVSVRIDQGVAALEAGDIETAYDILMDVHRAEPENSNVAYFLAVAMSFRGELDEAITLLHSISNFDQDPQLQLMASQFLLQEHQIPKAKVALVKTLELQPQNVEVLRLLANLEANLLNANAARSYFSAIDLLGESTAQDIFLYCSGDRARYDLYENLDQLKQAFSKTPDDPEVVYALFDNYVALDRLDDARDLLEQTSGKVTGENSWRISLASAELSIIDKDFSKAAKVLGNLPDEADGFPRTWIARGRVLRNFDPHVPKAIEAFRNAATLDPYDPEAVFMLSQLMKSSDPEASKVLLQRSHDLQALNVQVEAVVTLDHIDEAVERIPQVAEQLIELGAKREAYGCLNWLQREGYRFKSALEALDSLVAESEAVSTTLHVPSVAELRPWSGPTVGELSTPGSLGDENHSSIYFDDVTSEYGLEFTYQAVEDIRTTVLTSLGGGVAAFDFDRDGAVDLFFPQGGPLPNAEVREEDIDRCYRLIGNQFFDVTHFAGFGASDYGHGVAVGDVNNDGFADLVVTNFGNNDLYINNGDGTFDHASASWGITGNAWSTSASFADLNKNGNLDLYVVNYLSIPVAEMVPCNDERSTPCGPLNIPGQQDQLWENLGNERFRDRTESAGILVPDGKGLGVVIADFDNDRNVDIFVGNDTTSNRLFVNDSSDSNLKFREQSLKSGVGLGGDGKAEACMGIACADVDQNGFLDIFVSNFEGEDNTLYSNVGNAMFVDLTEELGLGRSSYQLMGWGAQFFNIDADGMLDLVVLNGHLHERSMKPQVYRQTAAGFEELKGEVGDYFLQPRMGRALAVLDLNRDHRPDLISTTRVGAPHLLLNNSTMGNRLVIRLAGTASNRDAIGARVTVECHGKSYFQTLHGGGGYLSANESKLFFAIGEHDNTEKITIEWPNGQVDSVDNPFSSGELLIIESTPQSTVRVIQLQ